MPTRADDSFERELRLFLGERRRKGLAPRAEPVFVRALTHFREHLGMREPRAAREADVVSFLSSLKRKDGRPISPWTRASWLHALRSFHAFLERRGHALQNPAREVRLPRFERLPRRVLTLAQAGRLMSTPSPCTRIGQRDRAILEVLYGTGIRVGECSRLDLADVDLLGGTILIRDGKGRKDRFVPLCGRAAHALDVYLRDARPELARTAREPALFLSHERERARLGISGFELVLQRHATAARLGVVSPHVLRHTCATHLVDGGADVRHVQELLGHESLLSTAIYTRVSIQTLRGVIRRCHPREKRR